MTDAVGEAARVGAPDDGAPIVSVIVATFDNSACLRPALCSIQRQDLSDFEVIVVGDACTDDSGLAVAALEDRRFRWINRAQNSGSQSAPNNDGIALARGRYIAFLGHDDLWFPWHLSGLVGAIEAGDSDLVHAMMALLLPGNVATAIGPLGSGHSYATRHVPPSGWLHRRELVDVHGPWPAPWGLRAGVDATWLARAYDAGCRIECHPRLSVLKFPSLHWRGYDPGKAKPQPEFLERMNADPLGCERHVLTQIAAEVARAQTTLPAVSRIFADASRQLARTLAWGYGLDRWPLRPLLRARFQRYYRGKLRRRRGLPPVKVRASEVERMMP